MKVNYIVADDYQARASEIVRKPCSAIIDAEQYSRQMHNAIVEAEQEMY